MSMLLILNILLDILVIIALHGRLIITHLKDIFNDSCTIEVSITNTIMALRHYNLLITKLEITKKDTIKGTLIEDVPQKHVASILMFKHMHLSRIHINRKGIPLEIFMQLLIPQVMGLDINLTNTSFSERRKRRYFKRTQ